MREQVGNDNMVPKTFDPNKFRKSQGNVESFFFHFSFAKNSAILYVSSSLSHDFSMSEEIFQLVDYNTVLNKGYPSLLAFLFHMLKVHNIPFVLRYFGSNIFIFHLFLFSSLSGEEGSSSRRRWNVVKTTLLTQFHMLLNGQAFQNFYNIRWCFYLAFFSFLYWVFSFSVFICFKYIFVLSWSMSLTLFSSSFFYPVVSYIQFCE